MINKLNKILMIQLLKQHVRDAQADTIDAFPLWI